MIDNSQDVCVSQARCATQGHRHRQNAICFMFRKSYNNFRDVCTSQARCATQGRRPLHLFNRSNFQIIRFCWLTIHGTSASHKLSVLRKDTVPAFLLIGKSFTEKAILMSDFWWSLSHKKQMILLKKYHSRRQQKSPLLGRKGDFCYVSRNVGNWHLCFFRLLLIRFRRYQCSLNNIAFLIGIIDEVIVITGYKG